MNKNHLPYLIIVLLLSACQTTGDLRSKRPVYKDPVVTEDSPDHKSHQNVDELERELAITKGKIVENEEIFRREKVQLEERIQTLEKQNSELLAQIAQQGTPAAAKKDSEAPASNQSFNLLWKQAMKEIAANRWEASEQIFFEIISIKAPANLSFYSYIGAAFSQYNYGNFKDAALTFNDILDKYPKHKNVSLAWFGQGAAFDRWGRGKDSKIFYTECIRLAPKSREAKLATQILAKKATAPADMFASFPNWAASSP